MTATPKSSPDTIRLVLVPAIISFAITILRLVGELNQWSPTLFSREAGGGGAIVGISWLVPVFGVYFAVKLIGSGFTPKGSLKVILFALAGIAASMLVFMALSRVTPGTLLSVLVYVVGAAVGILFQRIAWPELFRTLLAYAFAARIPVALIMLAAIFGEWGTHYDATATEEFAAMGPLARWFFIGAVPQFTAWILFTVVFGTLFGGLAALAMRTKAPEELVQTS